MAGRFSSQSTQYGAAGGVCRDASGDYDDKQRILSKGEKQTVVQGSGRRISVTHRRYVYWSGPCTRR